ncbi:MAG TPA: DUF6152 family protein [Bryobacteraceae bacterium]|nr:DUF6152 family protein [Bryobacteraceae bacterium]
MNIRRIFGIATAGLLLVAMPVLAHHSFQAEYDENKLVTVNGTVTKVAWINPHVMLNVDVRDDSGKVANWEMELASPNGLLRQGWKLDSLKPGDQVTVSGYAARDGSHLVNARRVILGGKAYSTIKDDK